MNKGSKFAGVLNAARSREAEEDTMPETASAGGQPVGISGNVFDRPLSPRPGRPRAKRSDPEFKQVTAYIGKETHQAVKIALLQEGDGQEFSELVEQLLTDWLKTREDKK